MNEPRDFFITVEAGYFQKLAEVPQLDTIARMTDYAQETLKRVTGE